MTKNGDPSLFNQAPPPEGHEPLASRMRPRNLKEYVGQSHILGAGKLLRRAIEADQLGSILLSGPPGTGKTTLARVIANTTQAYFVSLNAVLAGVSEIRTAITQAQERKSLHGRKTILFVDEVHRWNKSQQDALLPWVENGTIVLVGATTENPFFEVNRALVSRSRIFQLKPLESEDLRVIAHQALKDPHRGFGNLVIELDPDALEHLIHSADGDARSLLNALELAVLTTEPDTQKGKIHIRLEEAEQSIQQKAVLYDKDGDYHFDTISAFIKSLRGSDPDAALFWMARMIRAGESPRFLFRRMLVSASEDVGLADPAALGIVEAAAAAFERVGMPEGQFFLAHAALYLCSAPKSNSVLGYFDALAAQDLSEDPEVPNHLRDPSRDKHGFGHGEGYKYPHAFEEHWVAQDYLPQSFRGKVFYQPGSLGWEARVAQQIAQRREILLSLPPKENSRGENLSFGPAPRGLDQWISRTEELHPDTLLSLRERLFDRLQVARADRVLVLGDEGLILLWEALRSCPEGLVAGVFPSPRMRKTAEDHGSFFELLSRPLLAPSFSELAPLLAEGALFDRVIGRNLHSLIPPDLEMYMSQTCTWASIDIDLGGSQKMSDLLEAHLSAPGSSVESYSKAFELVHRVEEQTNFGSEPYPPGWTIESTFSTQFTREIRIAPKDIDRWIPREIVPNPSPFAQGISTLPVLDAQFLRDFFSKNLLGRQVQWKIGYVVRVGSFLPSRHLDTKTHLV